MVYFLVEFEPLFRIFGLEVILTWSANLIRITNDQKLKNRPHDWATNKQNKKQNMQCACFVELAELARRPEEPSEQVQANVVFVLVHVAIPPRCVHFRVQLFVFGFPNYVLISRVNFAFAVLTKTFRFRSPFAFIFCFCSTNTRSHGTQQKHTNK